MQRRLPDRAAGRWDEAPLVAAAAVLEAVAGSEGREEQHLEQHAGALRIVGLQYRGSAR